MRGTDDKLITNGNDTNGTIEISNNQKTLDSDLTKTIKVDHESIPPNF